MWRGMHACTWLVGVVCVIYMPPLVVSDQGEGDFLNSFIIKVENNVNVEEVAREHGFTINEKLPDLDIFHLTHSDVARRSKRADETFVSRMKEDPRIKLFEQQKVLHRVKRSHKIVHDRQEEFVIADIKDNSKFLRSKDTRDKLQETPSRFNDKFYRNQWYLHDVDEDDARDVTRNIHLNVEPAWDMGFTGKGTVVSILDDGIDHTHPDIKRNYDPLASADLNDKEDEENDPQPDTSTNQNSHGTRCAGEIAGEAGNHICGVGVAYHTKIGGIRILDGLVTDSLEAKALMLQKDHIDIKSASWGPHDDGETMEGPSSACKEAMKTAVETGRNGKGTILVWAAGNGGSYDDNCGADGYVSSIESISVNSMSSSGELPFFGEMCTSTMVAVPTGGEATQEAELNSMYKIKVVTTDINGGCVMNFEGTSSAAPLAAGCLALVLQANPDLTWRDVQHIVAKTARIPITDAMWMTNGAGYHVNPQFGFGMMDCTRMVGEAQGWVNKPPQHVCETEKHTVNVDIPNSGCHKFQFDFDGCHGDEEHSVTHIEHIEVGIKLQPVRRGNIQIIITSPAGTSSEVLRPRKRDSSDEEIDFTFMSVHSWEEDPVGQWTLEVCDQPPFGVNISKNHGAAAHFESWQLRISGYHDNSSDEKRGKASKLTEIAMETIIKKEFVASRSMMLKRATVSGDANVNLRDDLNDDNLDTYVDTLDSLFETFKDMYDVRSLSGYLEDYMNGEDKYYGIDLRKDKNEFNGDKRGFTADNDINEETDLKREMIDILRDLDSAKTATGKSYLEAYVNRKREILREREIKELLEEVSDLLEDEMNLE